MFDIANCNHVMNLTRTTVDHLVVPAVPQQVCRVCTIARVLALCACVDRDEGGIWVLHEGPNGVEPRLVPLAQGPQRRQRRCPPRSGTRPG